MPRRHRPLVETPADAALAAALDAWGRIPSCAKGVAGEAAAVASLAAAGLDVWRPVSPAHRADLGVVGPGGRLIKAQVRVAGWIQDRGAFRVSFARRSRGRRIPFRTGEVDFFLIVCPGPAGWIYYVPATAVAGKSSGTFRPHRPQARCRHGGTDYEPYLGTIGIVRRASS
jgi:hypothetical protein